VSVPASWLKKLYHHQGDYFMLVKPGAIILCDPPADLDRVYGIKKAKESVVRVFLSVQDAEAFRDRNGNDDARITRTTLVGLFNLIPRIDSLSKRQYKAPVRIEVTVMDSEGCPRSIDTLHSTYELLS
jgi:hypothetical protein